MRLFDKFPADQEFLINGSDAYVRDIGAHPGLGGYYTIDDIGTIGQTGANILSLFAQDNWTVNSRLTLNLGIRFESEDIPSYRPDIQTTAIHFGWGQKVAPRIGFAYNLFGDDRVKVSGSYGRYYDWTKYELARGTFATGSMGPKVRAACWFAAQAGGFAAIGSINDTQALLRGDAGTRVAVKTVVGTA